MTPDIRRRRKILMTKAGIQPQSADWILDLEDGISDGLIASITALNLTPAFKGRRVLTVSGRELVFDSLSNLWRLT
jgi:hypothetical protein